MKNLIPQFIAEKFEKKQHDGSFKGSVLSLDLKGFTKMTGELMKNGKYGAETLSDIINRVFEPVIKSIYSKGGFITAFVGDAITAVFPEENYRNSEYSAQEILDDFNRDRYITLDRKKFKIEVRIGISYGDIEWKIISVPERSVYFFKGDAVYQAADAQQKAEPGECLKDSSFKKIKSSSKKTSSESKKRIKKAVLERFVPDRVIEMKAAGEFREIISVYISFDENDTDINELSKSLCTESVRFKGYLNKIDFGDKGGIALAFFGAPLKEEKYPEYAVTFAKELVKKFPEIRIGIAKGIAYCGFVGSDMRSEYTALGEVVNLSARLLSVTPPGEIRTDEWTSEYNYKGFSFEDKGSKRFKGFSSELKVFEPVEIRSKKMISSDKSLFVGREKEIQTLNNFISPIFKGKNAGYFQISGNAGTGKSMLVETTISGLKNDNFERFFISCDNITVKSLHPVISFLHDRFGLTEEMSTEERTEKLKSSLSLHISDNTETALYFIGNALGVRIENRILDSLEASDKYDNTILEIRNYLLSRSKQIPVIIEIDDIHKADEGTLDLIRSLCRAGKDVPVCVISTARFNEDVKNFDPGIEADPYGKIDLKTLTKESVRTIAEFHLEAGITDRLFEMIWEKSGGNPFYTEQLALYLKDSKNLVRKKAVYDIGKADHSIPESISSIIISRIDRLSLDLRRSIRTASVLGKEFSIKVLSGMLKNKSIITHIKRIEKEEFWLNLSEMIYIFKHALIRDSVYQMQLKKTLKVLHKLAAVTILKIFNNEIEGHYADLAYHFENAGDIKNTSKYLELAGRYAYKNYHLKEAFSHYEKYLRYEKRRSESSEINRLLGYILFILGDWSGAESYMKKSIACIKDSDDKIQFIKNYSTYSDLLIEKGESDTALEYLNKCMTVAKKFGIKLQQGHISNQIGAVYRMWGDFRTAVKHYKRALNVFLDLKDDLSASSVYDHLGMSYMNTGDFKKAMMYFNKALKIVVSINDPRGILTVYNNMGDIYYMQGDTGKALSVFGKAIELADKICDIRKKSIITGHLGSIYFYKGDYEKAFSYFKEALDISYTLGDLSSESYLCGNIGVIYRLLGKHKTGLSYFNRQLKLSEKMKNKTLIGIALGNIAFMHSLLGDFDKSNEMYFRAVSIAEEIGDKISLSLHYANLAENFRLTCEFDLSLSYYDKAFELTNEMDLKYHQLSAYYYLAELYNDMNESEKALENIRKATDLAVQLSRPDYQLKAVCLKNVIDGSRNTKERENELKKYLFNQLTEEQKARLNKSLFHISSKKVYKNEAVKIYNSLYKKFKYYEYNKALEELGV
ncbi:MAG: tetratricopeptide repeat protein [Candidatus Delongbacteria bacterium]|nr:tetratricopeptide repeat protein [Candidatus Delongbacteria bacterium]